MLCHFYIMRAAYYSHIYKMKPIWGNDNVNKFHPQFWWQDHFEGDEK